MGRDFKDESIIAVRPSSFNRKRVDGLWYDIQLKQVFFLYLSSHSPIDSYPELIHSSIHA